MSPPALLLACGLLGLGTPAEPPPAGSPLPTAADPACLGFRLALAGRLGASFPEEGVSRLFDLPQARVEGGIDVAGAVTGRIALVAVRSGGESGYIGVDGESIVPAFQVAEARATLAPAGLSFAAGLIDDPFAAGSEAAFSLRAVAPSLAEEQGWLDRSDLGMALTFASPGRLLTLTASLTSGEGARSRERNDGKDLAGLLVLRPLGPARGDPGALEISLFARDGSRGLDSARDHRAGARIAVRAGPVRAGVEALGAWGVGGDAARTPAGGSAWAVLRPVGPLVAWGRLDVVSEEPGNPDAVAFTFRGGAGVEWSPYRGAPPVLVAGGYEGGGAGPDAAAVAGAEALSSRHRAFLLLGVDLSAAFPFALSDPNRPRGAAPPSLR